MLNIPENQMGVTTTFGGLDPWRGVSWAKHLCKGGKRMPTNAWSQPKMCFDEESSFQKPNQLGIREQIRKLKLRRRSQNPLHPRSQGVASRSEGASPEKTKWVSFGN